MKCAWQAYIQLLPHWLRPLVDKLGRETLQELRLRIGQPPELVLVTGSLLAERFITEEDLDFCVNAASQYSPWASATLSSGYITASGGHRLGICGNAIIADNKIRTVTKVTSLCIRVARDFPEIATQAAHVNGSTLIIGSPGRGKTTLLRDLIRQKSVQGEGAVGVVDERRELFPMVSSSFCFPPGQRTDILSGCNKADGIEILIRTMNPRWIAVDEITAVEDCHAILHAARCGVSMLATAHGENMDDFTRRPIYRPLLENKIFDNYIVMQPNQTWSLERMNV